MKEKKNITAKLALLSVLIPAVIPSHTVLALEENEIKVSGIEQSKNIHEKDDLEYNISEMVEEQVNTCNGDNQELPIDNQNSHIKDEQNLTQLNEGNKVEIIKSVGIALDTTNFPDKNFRDYLASNFDMDGDNYLSQEEVETITDISVMGISDLTGIKLLTSLSELWVSNSSLNKIDIRGMKSITYVNYASNNPNLVELDLRECPNLVTAFHATQSETVLISAGMTQYIGCTAIHAHTGHIVIDLRGIASSNSDGSKTIDLSTVISPELLSVFKQNDQPGFDENTNMLTIPKNETSSDYIAGKDEMENSTYWTFYTDYDSSEDNSKGAVNVTYIDTEGNKISEDVVKSGNIGEDYSTDQKEIEGYTFKAVQGDVSGKFTDQVQTVTYIYGQNDENVPEEDTGGSKESESSTEKQTANTSSVSQRSDISNSGSKYLPTTGEKATFGLSFAGLCTLVLAGYYYFRNKK